jgi:hypothetical protein
LVCVSVPKKLVGSQCVASVAVDCDVTSPITKAGVVVVTVTFAQGSKTGVFSCAPFSMAAGESLTTGQATRTGTLIYDLTFAFVGVTD